MCCMYVICYWHTLLISLQTGIIIRGSLCLYAAQFASTGTNPTYLFQPDQAFLPVPVLFMVTNPNTNMSY